MGKTRPPLADIRNCREMSRLARFSSQLCESGQVTGPSTNILRSAHPYSPAAAAILCPHKVVVESLRGSPFGKFPVS